MTDIATRKFTPQLCKVIFLALPYQVVSHMITWLRGNQFKAQLEMTIFKLRWLIVRSQAVCDK